MILKERQVVCKKCSKVLTVSNPKGLRSAYCVCGICHTRIEVNFFIEDKDLSTSLNSGSNSIVTSLPVSNEVVEHVASLLVNGREYVLAVGNNIVGRWSPSSLADVQLMVQDAFLSRQHVMLNVYRLADGNLRITVKNYKNKNATQVNGKPLGCDNIVVSNGDLISMGDTLAKVIVRKASMP